VHLLHGDHAQAERHFLEVIARASGDPGLRATAGGAQGSLGALRLRQGRFEDAAQAYSAAAEALAAEIGPDNPATALVRLGHAQALRGTGERAAARSAYATARGAYASWYGEEHRATAYARLLQAEFHYLDGATKHAAEALGNAPAVLAASDGHDAPTSCRARALQRGVAAQRGQPQAEDADWATVAACLASDDAPPLVRVLGAVVDAEQALALGRPDAAARVQAAADVLAAQPMRDPLLSQRIGALRAAATARR
jgi:hypothetical protein